MSSLILRAMEPADIDAIYRWENDPSVWNVSTAHQPFSRFALQRFIDEQSLCDIYTSRQLRLMAVDGDKTVGCIDLFDFDPLHRRAAVGIIVDCALRRQGYGAAMIEALEAFASEHLNLHQLHCIIAEDNIESTNLFEHNGFIRCGMLHDWILSDGTWKDAIMLQKTMK